MRIDLDAKIRTRDGKEAGSVQRAVVDPETNEVTDLVVSTGGLLGHDVVVPRAQIESASRDGDVIVLNLTKDELDEMPDYAPAYYALPPEAWEPPSGYYLPPTGYLWPVSYPRRGEMVTRADGPDGTQVFAETNRAPAINKGATVYDSEDEDIGVVDDVRFDPQSGHLTGLVVRVGGVLSTLFGGGDTVMVAGHQIGRVAEEGSIHLRAGKDDLRRMDDKSAA